MTSRLASLLVQDGAGQRQEDGGGVSAPGDLRRHARHHPPRDGRHRRGHAARRARARLGAADRGRPAIGGAAAGGRRAEAGSRRRVASGIARCRCRSTATACACWSSTRPIASSSTSSATRCADVDPIIVPEHRFVQAVELVYGVAVPARFASLAAKLRQRATDPNRARLVPQQPAIPMTPARERHATPTPIAAISPLQPDTLRKVVTDVPMPNANPATAPIHEVPDQGTPRLTHRQPGAPVAAVPPETAGRVTSATPSADAAPLALDDARQAIDEADDRDGIFESLCRGARARLPFAAILTVHGEVAAGKLALARRLARQARAGRAVGAARQAVAVPRRRRRTRALPRPPRRGRQRHRHPGGVRAQDALAGAAHAGGVARAHRRAPLCRQRRRRSRRRRRGRYVDAGGGGGAQLSAADPASQGRRVRQGGPGRRWQAGHQRERRRHDGRLRLAAPDGRRRRRRQAGRPTRASASRSSTRSRTR